MLVELTIRQWTAKKHDKRVSREVDTSHNANGGGRYNKQLVEKSALAEINACANSLRTFHYSRTLPWGNNGQRILPSKLFLDYRAELVTRKDKFNRLVCGFVKDYPNIVAEARHRLGSLYNPSDYPGETQIRSSFGIEFDFFPIPTAGDFRVDMAHEDQAELRAQIEAATAERQKNTVAACYTQVGDVLRRLQLRCEDRKARITEALVGDVHELAEMLGPLNITNDPGLTRIGEQIRSNLLASAEDLRRSPAVRQDTADRALDILNSITWA